MRKFSATLESPKACDCCGNALAEEDNGLSRGKFRLEFDEPAKFSLGGAVRVTVGGGKLEVLLRQTTGSGRRWGLRKNYNSSCFARMKQTFVDDETQPESLGWYKFTFDLPEFKPAHSTWWAELVFVEVGYGSGDPVESHNAATFRLKLETLS